MKTSDFVKSLFRDYEETAELRDFMEELERNLEDRVAHLVKKGLPESDAFAKASAELGDISALADELSLKRRQEAIQDAYLGIRRYMKIGRVAAYVISGAALLLGIICALVAYLSVGGSFSTPSTMEIEARIAAFGTLMIFFTAAVMGFTFLVLTQESAARYPMGKKRAAWYTLASGLIAFGITLFPLTYFAVSRDQLGPFFGAAELPGILPALMPALAAEIPFLIPGAALLAFLCLTEKNRLKPWAIAHYWEEQQRSEAFLADPAQAARFGLFSGAIWIGAAGLFIALGFVLGFRFSWLVFIFAVAIQLVVQGLLSGESRNNQAGNGRIHEHKA
ncbi:MAG: permease prefix domain 1-containing protein [Treponema sp.]|jgi:hypothetical protein|nr:permease prefix domain 1-containing protein [Treponema sp.]